MTTKTIAVNAFTIIFLVTVKNLSAFDQIDFALLIYFLQEDDDNILLSRLSKMILVHSIYDFRTKHHLNKQKTNHY